MAAPRFVSPTIMRLSWQMKMEDQVKQQMAAREAAAKAAGKTLDEIPQGFLVKGPPKP
jgi:hypothetical protein